MKKVIILVLLIFIFCFGSLYQLATHVTHEKHGNPLAYAVNNQLNMPTKCNCKEKNSSATPEIKKTSFSEPDSSISLYYTNTNFLLPLSNLQDQQLSPFTRWTQRFIHDHQHPSTCNKSKILISDGHQCGFGSEMHVIGAHLAYAIQNNLVLVLSHKTCGNFPTPSNCTQGCLCMLRPITHCGQDMDIFNDPSVPHIQNIALDAVSQLPDVLVNKLKTKFPSMTRDQMKYWWRGQSAAYLMRFNDQTMDVIYSLRRRQDLHYITGGGPVPFPLPPGTISAHIRGGDKASEMTLVPARDYILAIQKLINTMPNSFSRVIFVSGDDESSINEARKLTEEAGMTFIYTLMPRPTGGHNIGTWRPTPAHDTSESSFYGHLMQLFMNLEADAWVGTRGSNWNRLIDELRCVFVDKCQGIYVEVGKEEPAIQATYFW